MIADLDREYLGRPPSKQKNGRSTCKTSGNPPFWDEIKTAYDEPTDADPPPTGKLNW